MTFHRPPLPINSMQFLMKMYLFKFFKFCRDTRVFQVRTNVTFRRKIISYSYNDNNNDTALYPFVFIRVLVYSVVITVLVLPLTSAIVIQVDLYSCFIRLRNCFERLIWLCRSEGTLSIVCVVFKLHSTRSNQLSWHAAVSAI